MLNLEKLSVMALPVRMIQEQTASDEYAPCEIVPEEAVSDTPGAVQGCDEVTVTQ